MSGIETKAQLIAKLRESRAALERVISKVEPQAMLEPGVCGIWSGKDVLAHVAHWQKMHLGWWASVKHGEIPQVPAPGFSWSRDDVDQLNHLIFLEHRDQPLDEILQFLRVTFEEFMSVVEGTPEEDLFYPGLVSFTGSSTLARWYRDYAFHDGFGRSRIYNALVRKQRTPAQ